MSAVSTGHKVYYGAEKFFPNEEAYSPDGRSLVKVCEEFHWNAYYPFNIHRYGRILYEEGEIERALPVFQASLSAQLVFLGLFGKEMAPRSRRIDQIPEIFRNVSFEPLFGEIENGSERILEKLAAEPEPEVSLAGKNLRWLGNVLRCLHAYRKPEYRPLFEAIYGLAKRALSMVSGEDARLERELEIPLDEVEMLHECGYLEDMEKFTELKRLKTLLKQENDTSPSVRRTWARVYCMECTLYKSRALLEGDKTEQKKLFQKVYEKAFKTERVVVDRVLSNCKPEVSPALKACCTASKLHAVTLLYGGVNEWLLEATKIKDLSEKLYEFMMIYPGHFLCVKFWNIYMGYRIATGDSQFIIDPCVRALNLCSGALSNICDRDDGLDLCHAVEEVEGGLDHEEFLSAFDRFSQWCEALAQEGKNPLAPY